tara:strand:- start:231 stop:1397 length:1167 start_codon:yes stop_codon:yes gene_type:complete
MSKEIIIKKITNCGTLTLFRRENSKSIQCRYYDSKNKKLVRFTTETNSITNAEQFAKEKYFEYRQKEHNLELVSDKTYESVGWRLIDQKINDDELNSIDRDNRSQSTNAKYKHQEIIQVIGQVQVIDIDKMKINEVLNHIRKIKNTNKKSTLNKYMISMREVLNYAIDEKIISHLPNFPKVKGTKNKRQYFEKDLYNKICSAIRQRMIEDKKNYKLLEELYDVFVVLVNTGIRWGSEFDNLKIRDFKNAQIGDEDSLEINIRTSKTKERRVISQPLKSTFKRIKKRYSNADDYIYLPHLDRDYAHRELSELFKDILISNDLDKDENGIDIVLYSTRHTYIVWRLLEGHDIHSIAVNCGTSVQMIEQHYAYAVKPMQYAEELSQKRKIK